LITAAEVFLDLTKNVLLYFSLFALKAQKLNINMSNRSSSTARIPPGNDNGDSNNSDAEAICCLIRVLVCFACVILEVSLISVGYTLTPWFFIWLLILLVRRPKPRGDPAVSAQEDISPASRLERRRAFAAKVEDIKCKILDRPPFPSGAAAVTHEEGADESIGDPSMLLQQQHGEGPTNGMYNVHAEQHGRGPWKSEKYKLELRFSKTGQDGWSIHGQGRSMSTGRILFIIKEGHVKECSAADGRGEAYWVGEMPTSGRAHVVHGHFDFRMDSFHGRFLSDMGQTGYFVTFELHGPGDASHQLVPTDDPDLEAPMAEAVVALDASEEDAQDERQLSRILSKYETNAVAHHVIPPAIAVADVIPLGTKPITKPRPETNTLSLLGPSGLKPLPIDFRQAVTVASLKTTEIDAGSRKKVVATDPLNGGYDIQFEGQDGTLVNGTMELTFTRGFRGWNISGTKRNHKNDDDDDDDDGLFSIQRGFLAQSGKMYWEERRELKPSYSVLVVGRLDVDTAGSFHGEWLSSSREATTTNTTRGRFLKFVRRDDNAQHENVAALSSADYIV
jgi:hypothetical protein